MPHHPIRAALIYGAVIVAGAAGFLLIQHLGSGLIASQPRSLGTDSGTLSGALLPQVLLSLLAVILAAHTVGKLFLYLRQPSVVGEIIAGIALGPSLLGRVWPEASQWVLPTQVAPHLAVISQVGVILYMFLVGLELDPRVLRERRHATILISHASIVLPFVLGSALALFLYPRWSSADVSFSNFALFCGISMSVTAFPVLARILEEQGLTRTRLGSTALAAASVDDVTAWCLLAGVVGIVHGRLGGAARTAGLTIVFVAVLVLGVRPALYRFFSARQSQPPSRSSLRWTFIAILGAALLTETIGVHALFGAFLVGTVIPRDSALAGKMRTALEELVVVVLLPSFFAYTGLHTRIGLLDPKESAVALLFILLTACVGKFGGSYLAARLSGLPNPDATAIGLLMNTRGLMELVVLNVGLELGILSPALFTLFVLMAVITTLATTPLVQLVKPRLGASLAPVQD